MEGFALLHYGVQKLLWLYTRLWRSFGASKRACEPNTDGLWGISAWEHRRTKVL